MQKFREGEAVIVYPEKNDSFDFPFYGTIVEEYESGEYCVLSEEDEEFDVKASQIFSVE